MATGLVSDIGFSRLGLHAKTKLVLLGSSSSLRDTDPLRSLNIEHVSPAVLIQPEISRRTPLGQKAERAFLKGSSLPEAELLAVFRRWFWTRKPDAGFVLTDFPATLLQAMVLDEWLETRDESLDAVLAPAGFTTAVSEHYRTLGLLQEA